MNFSYSNFSYGEATDLLYTFIRGNKEKMKPESIQRLLKVAAGTEQRHPDEMMVLTDLTIFLEGIRQREPVAA